jgi:hypothetical protein
MARGGCGFQAWRGGVGGGGALGIGLLTGGGGFFASIHSLAGPPTENLIRLAGLELSSSASAHRYRIYCSRYVGSQRFSHLHSAHRLPIHQPITQQDDFPCSLFIYKQCHTIFTFYPLASSIHPSMHAMDNLLPHSLPRCPFRLRTSCNAPPLSSLHWIVMTI